MAQKYMKDSFSSVNGSQTDRENRRSSKASFGDLFFLVTNHLRKPALDDDDRLLFAALTNGPEIR